MMAEKEDKAMDPTMDALKKKRMSITIMLGPDDDMEEMGEETLEKSMEEKNKEGSDLAPEAPALKTADAEEEEEEIPELPGKLGARAMEMMRAKKDKMKG